MGPRPAPLRLAAQDAHRQAARSSREPTSRSRRCRSRARTTQSGQHSSTGSRVPRRRIRRRSPTGMVGCRVFLLTAQLFFTAFLAEAANAFGAGIKAANPAATGTFTWSGLGYVQDTVTYSFVNGQGSSVGGAWTPFAWVLWAVATICVGRLWRVASLWRRRQAAVTQTS